MSAGRGGGSLASRFVGWAGSTLGSLILIGAVLIAAVGITMTASLYAKGAEIGGQSTGMTLAAIPDFFKNIAVGQKAYGSGGGAAQSPAKKDPAKPNDKIDCKTTGPVTVCKPAQ